MARITACKTTAASALPIVLMIDEVDALVGDTLISLLRQLREGYIGRPGVPFVQSVILCGAAGVYSTARLSLPRLEIADPR